MASVSFDTVLAQARQLPPEDQARLAAALDQERAQRLIQVLDEWMADDSGYDEVTWPEVKMSLDRERDQLGMRRLFGE